MADFKQAYDWAKEGKKVSVSYDFRKSRKNPTIVVEKGILVGRPKTILKTKSKVQAIKKANDYMKKHDIC